MFKNKQGICILMTISVADIMKKKLETIKEMASVQQAAHKMKEKNVSSLVVVDEAGKPQGLVTERELVTKICISNVLASAVTNNEIMSSPLLTISADSSPSIAADMMLRYNIRHLLVVDKNSVTNARPILSKRYWKNIGKYTEVVRGFLV